MASIICGNCGNTHDSVGEVRACYSRPNQFHAPEVGATLEIDVLPWTPDDAGIYKSGEDIYKVYKALNGNHMLCKKLVADKFKKTGEFVYMGAPKRFVKHSERMSLEDAKKFGQIYGVCCQCGRTLTDESSIAAGIGPICAGKVAF